MISTINNHILIKGKCQACNGTKVTTTPVFSCDVCNASFTSEELTSIVPGFTSENIIPQETNLPCGHPFGYLSEYWDCPACEGEGTLIQSITLAELKTLLEALPCEK